MKTLKFPFEIYWPLTNFQFRNSISFFFLAEEAEAAAEEPEVEAEPEAESEAEPEAVAEEPVAAAEEPVAAAEEPVAAAEEPAVAAEEPAVVAEEPEVWLNWWVYFVLVQKWIYESSTFPTFLVRLRWYFNLISKTDSEKKLSG